MHSAHRSPLLLKPTLNTPLILDPIPNQLTSLMPTHRHPTSPNQSGTPEQPNRRWVSRQKHITEKPDSQHLDIHNLITHFFTSTRIDSAAAEPHCSH